MPADFLRRLIGRAPPPAVREAINELAALVAERPALAEPCRFLREILPVLFGEAVSVTPLDVPDERAQAKWRSAVPLLRGEVLAPDPGFARRWRAVGRAAGRPLPDIAEARHLTDELLAGRPESIHTRATELGLDAALTATTLRLTLLPLLAALSAQWAERGEASRWEQGFCPICGTWPLLGEFRGLEQRRVLRCGLCSVGWELPRLRCPFCQMTDHLQLGYFFVESEEGKYRVATCSACRGYVKMVSTLNELSPPRLLVADVATLHLDLAAADRGFVNI